MNRDDVGAYPGRVSQIVVLDYGSGNLRSAERALRRVGADVTVTDDFDAAVNADGLVVPAWARSRPAWPD